MISNFKIVLIDVYRKSYRSHPKPSLGILSIASYLTQKKVVPRKNIMILDSFLHDPVDYLVDFKPDLIGISSLTISFSEALNLAKRIRKISQAPLVIGGIHISACPYLLDKPFDLGVIGEGEEAFCELVKLFLRDKKPSLAKLKRVKGVAFRDEKGNLVITPKRSVIWPLDKIPPTDWSLLPKVYFRNEAIRVDKTWKALKVGWMFTSRGCPYNCIFCGRSILWPGVRFFGVKRVAEEVEKLVKKHHVEAIRFVDDTFSVNSKERIKQLIRELKKRNVLGRVIFYFIYARTDNIDEEMHLLLKELGVKELFFGFESGSDKILAFLKNDTTTVAINKKAVDLVSKFGGIGIRGSFMLGSPGENKKDVEKTVAFIKWLKNKNCVNDFGPSATTPFPGAPLWNEALGKGIVSPTMDWKQLLWDQENPKFFFKDSLNENDFSKAWKLIEKWRSIHRQKLRSETGWGESREKMDKENKQLLESYSFDFILHNLRMGRFGFITRWLLRKIPSHLISKKKLSEDIKRLKTFTNALFFPTIGRT